MALPVVLECPEEDQPLLLYALRTVFLMAGVAVEPTTAATVAGTSRRYVYCGPTDPAGARPPGCALAIPTAPGGVWRDAVPQPAHVEGVPVLYVADRPRFLVRPGELGFDLANACAYLLTLGAERGGARDEWDRPTSNSTRLRAWGLLDRPLLDHYARLLATCVAAGGDGARAAEPVPSWPHGRRFAVALTHDVDGIAAVSTGEALRYMARPRGAVTGVRRLLAAAAADVRRRPLPRWDLAEWSRVEASHGTRSTFFLFQAAREHPTNVPYRLHEPIPFDGHVTSLARACRELASSGWEIGLHASYHTSGDADLLRRERAALQNATRTPVEGVRQHYLHLDAGRGWRAHHAAGLRYDATLGFNDAAGYRAGTGLPFRPYDATRGEALPIWALPLVAQDIALLREVERGEAASVADRCRALLQEAKAVHGLVTLSWHPNLRTDRPDLWEAYATTLGVVRDEQAWVAPASEIIDWWTRREALAAAA